MEFNINKPNKIKLITARRNRLNLYSNISLVFSGIIAFLILYFFLINSTHDVFFLSIIISFSILSIFIYALAHSILQLNKCNVVNNNDCEKLLEMTRKNESVKNYIILTNKQNRPIHNYEYSRLYRIVETQKREDMANQIERQQKCHSDKLYSLSN
jgi:hypothetical protein